MDNPVRNGAVGGGCWLLEMRSQQSKGGQLLSKNIFFSWP
jgi:hypothetical protein